MTNLANKVDFLRNGFTEKVFKSKAVQVTGDWVALKAVHPADLSKIEQAVEIDYSHCLVHQAVALGPQVKGGEVGLWAVVIRNALDSIAKKKRIVVCKEEDIVFWINPELL